MNPLQVPKQGPYGQGGSFTGHSAYPLKTSTFGFPSKGSLPQGTLHGIPCREMPHYYSPPSPPHTKFPLDNFKTWRHNCHRDTGTHSCHRRPVGRVLTSLWISRSFCSLSVFHRRASARASSSMWNVSCPTLLPSVTCPRPVLACARSSMFSSRS